jgi:hypothetical protein
LCLAFIPFGCGGGGVGAAVHHPSGGPSLPDATVAELKACAEHAKDPLKGSYSFAFDFKTTESGHAELVKLKEAYPGDAGIASCMVDALEDMQVPSSIVQALLAEAESKAEAEAVSPQARGLMGNVWMLPLGAAGGAITVVETMLILGGGVLVVAVTVSVTQEVVETISKRKRAKCLNMYVECTSRDPPCTVPRDWHYYLCSRCQSNCESGGPYYTTLCKQCGFE